MIGVLFVCLGNICRSPMAEALFMDKVRSAGLDDNITADSAGTSSEHAGQPPHPGTLEALRRAGITSGHIARQVRRQELGRWDYVVAMDTWNREDLGRLGARPPNLRLLMEFAPETGFADVPDPYVFGGFDLVYELIDKAVAGLLQSIRDEHGL